MHSKSLLAATLAAALLGSVTAAQAYTAIVSVAPPAARHEVVPAPRAGWVWAPGHYEWRGNEYRWMEGHWLRERAGYEYREPRWVQRADGSWVLVGNSWERRMEERQARREERREERREARRERRMAPNADFDRDGIANRHDKDVDGDGVRNGRDRSPYNPRRS